MQNYVIIDKVRNKCEQRRQHKLKQQKIYGTFDTLSDMIEYVMIVKWIDTPGNINHAVNIYRVCINDSN